MNEKKSQKRYTRERVKGRKREREKKENEREIGKIKEKLFAPCYKAECWDEQK